MSQTAVTEEARLALPGGLGDSGHDMHIRSYAMEGTGGDYGLFVVPGTDGEKQVALPSGDASGVLGCLVHQHPLQDEALAGGDAFADGETAGVLTKGRVWAQAEAAMAVGDDVYVVNTGANAGQVRNDNTSADQLTQARVEQYDADSSLVLLSVNLP